MSDDEIRDEKPAQFVCKNCGLVCDEEWLKTHNHLCFFCWSEQTDDWYGN